MSTDGPTSDGVDNPEFIDVPEITESTVVRRYTRQARFIRECIKNCVAWHHVAQRKRQEQTWAEKTARAVKRKEEKEAFNTLVNQARAKIWEIAEDLHDKTGDHSSIFYYQLLMQHSKKVASSRNINY